MFCWLRSVEFAAFGLPLVTGPPPPGIELEPVVTLPVLLPAGSLRVVCPTAQVEMVKMRSRQAVLVFKQSLQYMVVDQEIAPDGWHNAMDESQRRLEAVTLTSASSAVLY